MSAGKFLYRNTSGNFVEGEISLADYEYAANRNIRCAKVINAKYPDADPQFGTAWQQGLRSAGVYPKGAKEFGIQPTTFRDAMSGECSQVGGLMQLAGNTIVSPSVPIGNSTPASRLFLPEVILDFVEENLQENFDIEVGMFNSMIADDFSIAGPIYSSPTVNFDSPKQYDGRPIAQNALPRNLTSISASSTAKSILTESCGLQISDQATQLATLPLVQIILREQMRGAQYRLLWSQLSALISGNADANESALTSHQFSDDYDTTAGAGVITHKGWIKALWDPQRIRKYDSMVCTLDGYLAVQNRTGRPLMFDPYSAAGGANMGNAGSYGIDATLSSPANFPGLGISKVMIIPTGYGLTDTQLLLLDSTSAIRRVTNSLASYTASEQLVLQRSNFVRWDYGVLLHRLITEAFLLVDFTSAHS